MNLSDISIFYKNISELYSAGINGVSVFETLMSTEKDTDARQKFRTIVLYLKKGRTLTEALRASGFVPVNDLPMIHSGEKSGKLLEVFEGLSKNYEQSAEAERTIRGGLLKPFFSLLVALFLPPLPDLIMGKMKPATFALHTFGVIGVLLAITWFLYDLYMKSLFNLELARGRHNLFSTLPFFRTLTKKMAMQKFVSSVGSMLDSGISIFEALELSGRSSPDTEVQSASIRVVASLKAGKNLPQAFKPESVFSDDIKKSILIGNESGKLPEALKRSSDKLKLEVTALVERIAKTIPVIVYVMVSAYMAYVIIAANLGQMKELEDALKQIDPATYQDANH